MLIKGLLDLIYGILDLILFTELPPMPDTLLQILEQVTDYVVMGVGVLQCFIGNTGMTVFAVSLALIFALNGFYLLWSMVFWILRKIPMLNIKE